MRKNGARMFCTKCGERLNEDAKFCSHCGAAVPESVEQRESANSISKGADASHQKDGAESALVNSSIRQQTIKDHEQKVKESNIVGTGAGVFSLFQRLRGGSDTSSNIALLGAFFFLFRGLYHSEFAKALKDGASEEEAGRRAKNAVVKMLKIVGGIILAIVLIAGVGFAIFQSASSSTRSSTAASENVDSSTDGDENTESNDSDSNDVTSEDDSDEASGAPAGYDHYQTYMCRPGNSPQLVACSEVEAEMKRGDFASLPFGYENSSNPQDLDSFVAVDTNRNGKIDDAEYGMNAAADIAPNDLPLCPQDGTKYNEELFKTGCVDEVNPNTGETAVITGPELRKEYEASKGN